MTCAVRWAACAAATLGALVALRACRDADREVWAWDEGQHEYAEVESLAISLPEPVGVGEPSRSFTVENEQFMLDGEPLRILAGSIHYFRVVPEYWEDRLDRIKAMGLNAITVYVAWNWHEARQGEFDFSSPARDLEHFLRLAHERGLFVLLRPGPYICAEWDFGGFPAWFQQNGTIELRTYAQPYLSHVTRFFDELLPRVKPLLYVETGGPVLMVQVENEYGSFGNTEKNEKDRKYIEYLVNLNRKHLGERALLFTTDGEWHQAQLGSLPDGRVLSTIDGCNNPEDALKQQRAMNPKGKSAFICSETYTGWLSHWGHGFSYRKTDDMLKVVRNILKVNDNKGSVSLYMAHGGTNWGFFSGANYAGKGKYQPDITSYDYNSPISEGGEEGIGQEGKNKFQALRALFQSVRSADAGGAVVELPPVPPVPPRKAWGDITADKVFPLLPSRFAALSSSTVAMKTPAAGETFGCNYGAVVYQTNITLGAATTLTVPHFQDRLYAWLDHKPAGVLYRVDEERELSLVPRAGRDRDVYQLTILVEHMGRINFDPNGMRDTRIGLLGTPELDGSKLEPDHGWMAHCLSFDNTDVFDKLEWQVAGSGALPTPALYSGTFDATAPADTYLDFGPADRWGKGVVWMNGFNLGRYWGNTKPQHTLYVPAAATRNGTNRVVLFEFEKGAGKLESVDKPDLPA